MRTIVIATPVKNGLDSNYMKGFVATTNRQFPGVKLEHAMIEGTLVNFNRNDLTHYAKSIGAREIVMVDSDMGWTDDHFARLILHENLDIVAGLYCKRKPGKPFWLMTPKTGEEVDPTTGLLEVEDAPTGFMKIRLDTVLPKIEAKFPHLEYHTLEKDAHGNLAKSWEYFPLGTHGPRTPAARLERVKNLMLKWNTNTLSESQLLFRINDALYDEQPPGELRGEDYAFCALARACGIKIYVDFGMPIIPHIGQIPFPITQDMVGIHPDRGEVVMKPN